MRTLTVVLMACVVLMLGLAAQPAQAVLLYATDFESPTYTTGYSNLNGQNYWVVDAALGHVQAYAGGSVPWVPQSTGVITYYSPPVANPYGGDQYVGLSTTTGGGSGNIRAKYQLSALVSGLLTLSVDFLNGPEHDFPPYQGGLFARNWAANVAQVGLYTCSASSYVDHSAPPARTGNWAYRVLAFDSAGLQLTNTGTTAGYRYDGVAGFDELPRETWWRLGVTFDTTTRRITQYLSKNLMTSEEWVMDNPQALHDYGAGPVLVDLYMRGGAGGTTDVDAVSFYNVGNGQLHLYDNPRIELIPEPATMALMGLGGIAMLIRRKKR